MNTSSHSYLPKQSEIEHKWYVVDADGQVLGRLATQISAVLRGRHKTIWAPHLDAGDFVVVINAAKVKVTGNKENNKFIDTFSGYMGGLKRRSVRELRAKRPERLIEHAVWGMMPHSRLGRGMMRRIKIYPGAEHPHAAQQPQPFPL